jgi:hypothetical protein
MMRLKSLPRLTARARSLCGSSTATSFASLKSTIGAADTLRPHSNGRPTVFSPASLTKTVCRLSLFARARARARAFLGFTNCLARQTQTGFVAIASSQGMLWSAELWHVHIAWSPDSRAVALSPRDDGIVRLYGARDGIAIVRRSHLSTHARIKRQNVAGRRSCCVARRNSTRDFASALVHRSVARSLVVTCI